MARSRENLLSSRDRDTTVLWVSATLPSNPGIRCPPIPPGRKSASVMRPQRASQNVSPTARSLRRGVPSVQPQQLRHGVDLGARERADDLAAEVLAGDRPLGELLGKRIEPAAATAPNHVRLNVVSTLIIYTYVDM